MERFLANVGHALIFRGDQFVGTAQSMTENTFSFSATPNEVRGGKFNPLIGRWFSDSTLNVTLTNATFKLEYLAYTLGTTIEQGGTAVYETAGAGETVTANKVTLTKTPAAFLGTMIGWYKKPSDSGWTVGTITQQGSVYSLNIPNAEADSKYCIKYLYMDENARMMPIPADFNPEELHVIIINDEYNADINTDTSASIVGQLITDIPRLGLDPSQDLTLNATSSAPSQLSGTAFRYMETDNCSGEASYGTMTEQVNGAVWQENVEALAVANNDLKLSTNGTATAEVYAVFTAGMSSKKIDNTACTFAVDSGSAVQVSNAGVITAKATGTATVSVNLTGYTTSVSPAYIKVTVS